MRDRVPFGEAMEVTCRPMKTSLSGEELKRVLEWCHRAVGPCELAGDDRRFHGRSSVLRLRTPLGGAYAKVHRQADHWESEVHAYEAWGAGFGRFAPKLLAVREAEPLGLGRRVGGGDRF